MVARTLSVLVLVVSACGPALPPPTVVVVTAPPEAPPLAVATATTAPAATEPPPFVPPAPFSVVARAPGDHDFAVFPLEEGGAVLAAASGDRARLRLAVLDHDEISPAPPLANGLPPAVITDPELPLVAGRWPDALWLARGTPCEVHHWEPQSLRWEPRAPKRLPRGKCSALAAWTPGAAIAAVQEPGGPSLSAFGSVHRAMPALPASAPWLKTTCSPALGGIWSLFAYPTGEVTAFGITCDGKGTWLTHWAAGAAQGHVVDAEIEPNGPSFVRVHTRDEIAIDGVGVLHPGSEGVSLEVRFQVTSGHLRRTSIAEHEINAQERWQSQARRILGLPEGDVKDGFELDGFSLTPTDDVLVLGHLVRAGKPVAALVLRNRPVKKLLALP